MNYAHNMATLSRCQAAYDNMQPPDPPEDAETDDDWDFDEDWGDDGHSGILGEG